MSTILAETARSHIEMVTMTLAACGKLHDCPEEVATLQAAARKLGVTEILLEYTGVVLDAGYAGEILVTRQDELIASFRVSKKGELTLLMSGHIKAA